MEEFINDTYGTSRLSREQKEALYHVLAELSGDRRARAQFRDHVFDRAREELPKQYHLTLNWMEMLLKPLLGQTTLPQTKEEVKSFFSPGPDCLREIIHCIDSTTRTMDICVFTITDDRISDRIIAASRRGVAIRIISDNDKSNDLGSDIERLHKSGIAVRIDNTDKHMHHKFAIFDGKHLLSGSYNWTRSAAQYNEENIMIFDNEEALTAFSEEFEKLWKEMTPY